MTTPTPRVEGFSLTHAQVLDGTVDFLTASTSAAPNDQDVYGVNNSSIDPNVDEYDNEGDDVVLSKWGWVNFCEINVQQGYLSFPLIAKMTGQTVSSSGAGAAIVYGIDLWGEASLNVAPMPMILRMPSRDENGVVRSLTLGLYKVQFMPITLDGPQYKDGLKVNLMGRALFSPRDEKLVAFADGKKRIAKAISHQ
jgi:hypothetical protein